MSKLVFADCGCQFDVEDSKDDIIEVDIYDEMPKRLVLDVYNLPMDCPATWQLLSRGDTKGVFQLEGHLGKTWAALVQPENMEHLSALVSLLRPGCLKAISGDPAKSMTERYKDRRHKMEEVEFFDVSELEPILSKTYGVLVYQEQSMQISVTLAGFNEQEADILRKAIGKKKPEIMTKVHSDFIEGCRVTAIVTTEQAEEIFGWIRKSQRYSFNKSHAMSYGTGSYWTAYAKAHFPVQFYCSYIDGAKNKQKKFEEIAELINDAKLHDIVVNAPDLRHMKQECYIHNNEVYFGLSAVRQLGVAALDKIGLQLRETELILDVPVEDWCWMDYLLFFSRRISKTINESLMSCGAIDFLGVSRTQMVYEYDKWIALTTKEQDWIITRQYDRRPGKTPTFDPRWKTLNEAMYECAKTKKEGGGCHNIRRVETVRSLHDLLIKPPHSLRDTFHYRAFCEEKYLGTSITCNIVDDCEEAVHANTTCREIADGKNGYTVLAVTINRVKEITTKETKQQMAFLTASDKTCAIDNLVCFPSDWFKFKDLLTMGNTVLIHCERSDDRSRNSMIIKGTWQI
jgi:DNA polymerase III alpha subunit